MSVHNFRTFTVSEIHQMKELILETLTQTTSENNLQLRQPSVCKRCNNGRVSKYGKSTNGKQRYRCNGCGSVLTETTFTKLAHSHLDLPAVEKYIECFLQGLSISETARICNICVRTAFKWRHKLLQIITEGAGEGLSYDQALKYFADRVLNTKSSIADREVENTEEEPHSRSNNENILFKCDISDTQALNKFGDMYCAYISDLSVFSERLRSEPVTENEITGIWNADNIEKLFITHEGKIVGFLLLGILANKHPESDYFIAEFYIQKEYRSLGIGTLAARELLENKGKYCLFILKDNERAISFWNKAFELCGYKDVSEQYTTNCCPSDCLFYMYEPVKE